MLESTTILFGGLLVVTFIIALLKESTVLFALDAALGFIMSAMVRLIVVPYSFLTSGDVVVSGTFVVDDASASIMFLMFGVICIVLYFVFRVQHSAEELQQHKGVKINERQ